MTQKKVPVNGKFSRKPSKNFPKETLPKIISIHTCADVSKNWSHFKLQGEFWKWLHTSPEIESVEAGKGGALHSYIRRSA